MNRNVFEEIGIPSPDEHLLKAQIVSHLADIIRSMELTQAQVAELAGLTQPQVSNILKGRFRDISIEKLLRITNALHHSVQIVISTSPSESATTTIELAA